MKLPFLSWRNFFSMLGLERRPAVRKVRCWPRLAAESLEERRVLTGSVGISAFHDISEGGGPTTAFMLSYSGDSSGYVTLPYSGTAMQGMDFTGPLMVNVPAGSGSLPIELTAGEDLNPELEKTISLMLTSSHVPPGWSITSASASISLIDNDSGSATVSVQATDSTASEGATDTGTYQFTRTGDTTSSLTIAYIMSGNATNGLDYSSLSGSITIGAGFSSANLTLTALDDGTPDGSEAAILTISSTAPPTYNIGTPSSATITIADSGSPPTITSNGGGATASISVAENQSAVTDVQSTDADGTTEGTGLTYSLTGGADQMKFTIAPSTGVLTFMMSPNFETPTDAGANNVYDVQVKVTDPSGLTDKQSIAVTVTNVNETPTITSNGAGTTANVSVAENQTAVTDVQSADPDGTVEGASGLTYSLTGGADQARFTIAANTGVLTFIAAPDFETPTDAGGNNVYDVQVTVTDPGGLTDVQDIAVNISNVNEAPTIISNGGGATVDICVIDNQTAVTDVQSTDPDGTTEGTGLNYSISGGADQAKFSIAFNTGVRAFNIAPDSDNPADADGDNVYDVQVMVTDSGGLSDVQNIAVTVSRIELTEAFGYGFEGDDLSFLLRATTTAGTIASYQIDVNQDGTFDASTTEHEALIGGALMFDEPLVGLLGTPADEGTYPATLRVTNSLGAHRDFPFNIDLGNTPPTISAEGPEDTLPGEPYLLSVATSDPGPDTVTSLVIAWGDGASETHLAGGGTFSHVYATDGIYVIHISATDEDGTWSLDYQTNIGDTDAPVTPSDDPSVISAIAEILPSGDAEITIDARDAQGNPITSLHWDLDGSGNYTYAGDSTVLIPPQAGFYPYTTHVRLVDSTGKTADVLLAFAFAGPADIIATITNCRELFRKATPDLPAGWRVHHTLQVIRQDGGDAILAARFLKAGINVNENQYLRGVPPRWHDEISGYQQRWWNSKVGPGRPYATLQDAYENIPLAEVKAQADKFEATYSKIWVKSGPNQSKAITKITNSLNAAGAPMNFVAGKVDRLKSLGFSLGTAVAIFTLATSERKVMAAMTNQTPDQKAQFQVFVDQYEGALETQVSGGTVNANQALLVRDSLVAYMRSLELDDTVISDLQKRLGEYIDLNFSIN